MSRAIDAAPPWNASVVQGGRRRTRQSRKRLIDAQRQSGNPVMAFSDNQEQHKKALRGLELKMIIGSLPAAASNSDCRRRSHPDCRATLVAELGADVDPFVLHLFAAL